MAKTLEEGRKPGSGRRPSEETLIRRQSEPVVPIAPELFLPNYSGVKAEALKTSDVDITGESYVLKSGDTMTGSLTAPNFTLSGSNGNIHIDVFPPGQDANLIFYASGDPKFTIGYDNSPAGFRIYNHGTTANKFYVDSVTGNIGMSTGAPSTTLEVSGSISGSSVLSGGLPVLMEETDPIFLALSGTITSAETDPIFLALSGTIGAGAEDDPIYTLTSGSLPYIHTDTSGSFKYIHDDWLSASQPYVHDDWASGSFIQTETDPIFLALSGTITGGSGINYWTSGSATHWPIDTSKGVSGSSLYISNGTIHTSSSKVGIGAEPEDPEILQVFGTTSTTKLVASNISTTGTLSGGTIISTSENDASGSAICRNVLVGTEGTPGPASLYPQGTIYMKYNA